MDLEELAEKIEKKIRELVVAEVGDPKRILRLEPIIEVSEEGNKLNVHVELELELSPFAKKKEEEVLKKVFEELDKYIQEITGKKPERVFV